MTITVAKLIDPLKLCDELTTAGYPYQGIGTVASVLTGYKSGGTTEPVPDAAVAVYTAHDPTPMAPREGLKVWDVSGVGELAGYDATGVEQVRMEPDGQMVAGGGAVVIDADGFRINAGSANSGPTSVTFTEPSTKTIGGLYGMFPATPISVITLSAEANALLDCPAYLYLKSVAAGGTNRYADIRISAESFGNTTQIYLRSKDDATTPRTISMAADLVNVTGALTVDGALNLPNIWTDWTPTVTQSGSVTVTVTEAKYALVGKVCHIYARLAITGAGTAGQIVVIGGIPTAAQVALPANSTIGSGKVYDSGTAHYSGTVENASASSLIIIPHGLTSAVGTTPNFALANGDSIGFSATYRVA